MYTFLPYLYVYIIQSIATKITSKLQSLKAKGRLHNLDYVLAPSKINILNHIINLNFSSYIKSCKGKIFLFSFGMHMLESIDRFGGLLYVPYY